MTDDRLTHVQTEVPLLQPPTAPRSNFSCFHWLSVCSFVLLLVATTMFALLHFHIIPTPGHQVGALIKDHANRLIL